MTSPIFPVDPSGSATWGPPGDSSSLWRKSLWRKLSALETRLAFIMLNPSTADATVNDPTIRRCIRYGIRWGFGELVVVNLFAWRATDPAELLKVARVDLERAIGPGNDEAIRLAALGSQRVIAAWGTLGAVGGRARAVARMVREAGRELECLQVTKHGDPAHPLYLRADLTPKPWSPTP